MITLFQEERILASEIFNAFIIFLSFRPRGKKQEPLIPTGSDSWAHIAE